MSASAQMPYFINPSIHLEKAAKEKAYEEALQAIDANLANEQNMILKMVTINCLLKTYLPYFYWAGFYMVNDGKLMIGPYQGTLGCLHIDFSQGVCGKAASTMETQIVEDVHELTLGSEHIACDPNSQSEIVVPVFDKEKNLIAVFDVDSSEKKSFDETDKFYLEKMVEEHFTKRELIKFYV